MNLQLLTEKTTKDKTKNKTTSKKETEKPSEPKERNLKNEEGMGQGEQEQKMAEKTK